MSAIRAVFCDLRTVKTRSACQLIFEIPIEEADAALDCLGGVPQPGRERWVGIAPLQSAVDRLLRAEEDGAPLVPATADEGES